MDQPRLNRTQIFPISIAFASTLIFTASNAYSLPTAEEACEKVAQRIHDLCEHTPNSDPQNCDTEYDRTFDNCMQHSGQVDTSGQNDVGAPSDRDGDSAYIWRGFTHEWTTRNHRIGRLGNWMSMRCNASGCTGSANHTAHVGTAADTASFRTAYTEITSDVAGFQSGHTNISVVGREGEVLMGTKSVSIPAHDIMRPGAAHKRYVALINGFDLEANAGAKLFDRLKILIGDLSYSNGNLEFDITWVLKVDCDHIECVSIPLNTVDYNLQVHYLLMAGDVDEFNFTNSHVSHKYSWAQPTEIWRSDHEQTDTIDPATSFFDFGKGTVALRGFNLNLDDDYHMFETVVRAHSIDYDPAVDRADYVAEVFFKPWRNGMDAGALRPAGATTNMEVWTTLLEFGDATIRDDFVDGTVESADQLATIDVNF